MDLTELFQQLYVKTPKTRLLEIVLIVVTASHSILNTTKN